MNGSALERVPFSEGEEEVRLGEYVPLVKVGIYPPVSANKHVIFQATDSSKNGLPRFSREDTARRRAKLRMVAEWGVFVVASIGAGFSVAMLAAVIVSMFRC